MKNKLMANKQNKGSNMKNKVLNKLLISVVCIVSCVVMVALFVGCQQSEKLSKMVDSVQNAKVVTSKIIMMDSSKTVYDFTRTVTVDGENATVETKELSLGDDFAMDEKETSEEVENIDKSTFFPVAFEKVSDALTSSNKNVYNCEIEQAKLKEVTGFESQLKENTTCKLVINCDDNKITSVEMSFTLATGRIVSVVYTYAY